MIHRFYIAPTEWNTDAPILAGSEAHHCRNVLRMERGDKVVVFDGEGRELTGEIVAEISSSEVRLRKLHEATTPPVRCRITLAQAIPKGKNMDLIVQKAVELGASEIAPLISDRTVVRLNNRDAAQKQSKWQTVAVEAAKQCGQNWLPKVQRPRTLAQFFSDQPPIPVAPRSSVKRVSAAPQSIAAETFSTTQFDLRLIASLQSDAVHLKEILDEPAREHDGSPTTVLILIGPEGDFTPAELEIARSNDCQPISLGPVILRVETAAIYCLSVLSYELLV